MKLKLRYILLGAFLLIIIILITTLGFITYNKTEIILKDQLKEESLKTMNNAYHYFIEYYISENEKILNRLLVDYYTHESLDGESIKESKELWKIIQEFNSNIWYIYIGTEDGNIYVSPEWDAPEGYDPRVRPWYQAALKNEGEISWSEPYLEYITGKMVVSSSITIQKSNSVVGVLSMDTSLDKINEILNDMDFGEQSYALLIDREGFLISHPDSRMIGKNIRNEKWYDESLNGDKGAYMYKNDNSDTIISYITIPETHWKLLAFIPRESLNEVVKPIRNRAVTIGIIGIIITIIIGYFISSWFTRNIDRLIDAMDEVEHGNLNIKKSFKYCKEFIDLGNKFNMMVDRIKKTESRLEHISFYDALTDVYNRNYFEEIMKDLQEKNIKNVGIIVFDVDGLKLINDSFGHDMGDQLLIEVVKIIRECIPEDSMLFRTGGDEFVLLVMRAEKSVLKSIYRDVKRMANNYDGLNNLPLSVSVGYSITKGEERTISKAYLEADDYMYKQKLHKSTSIRNTFVHSLMNSLGTRDFISEGHGERMRIMIEDFSRRLGFNDNKIHDLSLFAQFHDIGKVGISEKILFKEGLLTMEEREEVQKHSEMGYRIAMSSPHLNHIADWILKHHECWNGKGYPLGLTGEEIPIEARILTILDAYDSMTNHRPYRAPLPHDEAVKELRSEEGTMFDPILVEDFIDYLEGN